MKDITAILIEPEYLGKLALFNYDALFSWRCAGVMCLGGVFRDSLGQQQDPLSG